MGNKLILASGSPRRIEILSSLGLDFLTITPEVYEAEYTYDRYTLPIINAEKKCGSIARNHPKSLVLGADTVIEFNGKIIGKPVDIADSEKILKMLSGKIHLVITGVCIIQIEKNIKCLFCDKSTVEFKSLNDSIVKEYISQVNTLDKAGAYAIQEHGDRLIDNISGSFENIIGLPKEKVVEALKACGYSH